MAAYSILGADVFSAGIANWRIMGEDWVSLGDIEQGKVTATPQFQMNDKLMERPHGMLVEASGRIMATGKTTVLAFLDKLAEVQKHDIQLVNGMYLNLNYASTHTKWKFVLSGGPSQHRYIEIMVKRFIPFATASPNWGTIWTSAAQAATSDPEVTFSGWATTPATIWPAQITNFYVRNAGETTWEEPSAIRSDPTLELELITPVDDQNGCFRHNNLVKITADVTLLFSDEAGIIEKLDDVMQSTSNDIRMDGIDGTQFTFTDNMGFAATLTNEGPADNGQIIRVQGTGIIALSSLDNVFV